jgi:hypothetical protein
MKFRCINNDNVDGLLTVGKIYTGFPDNNTSYPFLHACAFINIFRCDDKHIGYFKPERFEVAEDLVPVEPTTTLWEYTVEGKEK